MEAVRRNTLRKSKTMNPNNNSDSSPSAFDIDRLSAEIFSRLESNWLSGGGTDNSLWLPQMLQEILAKKKPEKHIRRARVCVLSIDGGGVRAIIAAKALSYLEDSIRKKSGNRNAVLADYFDLVAGSGTGGVIAGMLFGRRGETLSEPLYSAEQAWRLLVNNPHKMYSPQGLLYRLRGGRLSCKNRSMERVLRAWFTDDSTGRSLTLRDTIKPLLIPCYDLSKGAPLVFSRADATESDSFNFCLSEVCRAATATPGVFSPAKVRSTDGRTAVTAIDGGLVMNNPCTAAITHVLNNKPEFPSAAGVDDLLVVSIGSGQFDRLNDSSAYEPSDCLDVVLSGVSDTVDASLAAAFSQCPHNYLRIQAWGAPSTVVPEMWEGGSRNIEKVVRVSEEMLKQRCIQTLPFAGKRLLAETNRERLDWIAEQLISEHFGRTPSGTPPVLPRSTPPSSSLQSPSSSSCFLSE